MATHSLRTGLRLEHVRNGVLLLDLAEGCLYSFEGDRAEVVVLVDSGGDPPWSTTQRRQLDALIALGLVEVDGVARRLVPVGSGAASAGASVLSLPDAAAAASASGSQASPDGHRTVDH